MAKQKKNNAFKPSEKRKALLLQGNQQALKGNENENLNMFERLWNRRKFDILGKKVKGEQKNIGKSRSEAYEKRKKTLLQQYNQSKKSNFFIDQRFGENESKISEEEKQILLFQRERLSHMSKKSKFNLDDNDAENEFDLLTHKGNAISNFDEFDDFDETIVFSDDEEDDQERNLNAEMVKNLNFGGGFLPKQHQSIPKLEQNNESLQHEEANLRHKTKKEIMEELIAKSKMYKAIKQQEKMQDGNLLDKLDTSFKELTKNKNIFLQMRKRGDLEKKGEQDKENEALFDDYETLEKEMVFDLRVKASDRTKTKEEIAKEEKEKLEELERKRKKRMSEENNSEDEEDENNETVKNAKRNRKANEISGDDLGEDFQLEEEYIAANNEDEDYGNDENDNDDDDDDEEEEDDEDGVDMDEDADDDAEEVDGEEEDLEGGIENNTMEKLWEQSDSESDPTLEKESIERSVSLGAPSINHGIATEMETVDVDEDKLIQSIPYVIEAPSKLPTFLALVRNLNAKNLDEVIIRILKSNDVSLSANNRKKIQVFYNVLFQYLSSLATEQNLSMEKIDVVSKHLLRLSQSIPLFSAYCAKERIVLIQSNFVNSMKNKDSSSLVPSVRIIFLFQLWSLIFPSSDFSHLIITPIKSIIAQYLSLSPLESLKSATYLTFLTNMLASICQNDSRFFPEVISFLSSMLKFSVFKQSSNKSPIRIVEDHETLRYKKLNSWLLPSKDNNDNQEYSNTLIELLDFPRVALLSDSDAYFFSSTFRLSLFHALLHSLSNFVSIYSALTSFPEAFHQFPPLLTEISSKIKLPSNILHLMSDIKNRIEAVSNSIQLTRQPLRMKSKRPLPIKQFNPKFEEDYIPGRSYDPDRERAGKRKLHKLVKRETRGAMRELRKDNFFLAQEKFKEKEMAEKEREEKYRKAMAFLEEQEANFKSGQLGKRRGKKRR